MSDDVSRVVFSDGGYSVTLHRASRWPRPYQGRCYSDGRRHNGSAAHVFFQHRPNAIAEGHSCS